MIQIHWHRRFIQMAGLVSTWSKDPSTKVGCVLVDPHSAAILSMGFNGFARGVQERATEEADGQHGAPRVVHTLHDLHPKRWERPEKYQWVVHAELNALLNAARNGVATAGCWAYMNFEPAPCEGCANALVQAGIQKIIGPNRPWAGNGTGAPYEVGEISRTILKEGGVTVETVVY